MMTFAVLLLALRRRRWRRCPITQADGRVAAHRDRPARRARLRRRARRGSAPLAVDAEAGRSYAVRAVHPGHRDDEQLVTAAAGDSPVRLHLDRLAATLAVETEPPGARVFVDGKETGKLTPTALELPPPHRSC